MVIRICWDKSRSEGGNGIEFIIQLPAQTSRLFLIGKKSKKCFNEFVNTAKKSDYLLIG